MTEPDPRYFQSRPSATEGGGQRGREHFLKPRAQQREDQGSRRRKHQGLLELNKNQITKTEYDPGLTVGKIPVEPTARPRGSTRKFAGKRLDPGHRIAAVATCPCDVDDLIAKHTSGRGLGFSGEEGVNVSSSTSRSTR